MRPVIAIVAAVGSVLLIVGGEPASGATESYLAASGRNAGGELGDGTGAGSLVRVQVLGLGTSIDITMPSVAAPGENYKLVPHAQPCSFPCESGTANAAGKFFTHA